MMRSIPAWLLVLLAAASPAAAQNGLLGEYYNTTDWTGAINTPIPNQGPINYNYGAGAPGGTTLGNDNFSARWRGRITAAFSETFTFYTTVDDQARLVINGTQVIALGGSTSGTFAMTAGTPYDFMLEYREGGGNASVRLEWSSTNVARQDIPLAAFSSPATAPATPTLTGTNGGPTPQTVGLATTTGGATIYYTLDGSDPGLTQPTSTPGAIPWTGTDFTVSTYTRIRARAYLGGVSSGLFTSNLYLPLFPAVTAPPSTQPGLYFKYFHGNPGNGLAVDFDVAPLPFGFPQQRGVNLTVTNDYLGRDRDDNFSMTLQGYVNIPTTGIWNLFTNSDDGSRLYVDGALVVNNDGYHGNVEQSGTIQLAAGLHAILITYFEGNGGTQPLGASWELPGTVTKANIPASALLVEPIVATPVITPAPGAFNTSQVVTITCSTPGALIYYTLGGSAPDVRGATGSGPSPLTFTITSNQTVRALAYAPGLRPSALALSAFTRSDAGDVLPAQVVAGGVDTDVLVYFDRPVSAASAGTAGNYAIDGGVTVSAATPVNRSASLIGHWRLDDLTGADSSPSNLPLTLTQVTADAANVPTLLFANPGSGSFNGTGSSAEVADDPRLDVGFDSFTVAAWIRPISLATTNRRIVGKWENGNTTGWFMEVTTGGALRFRAESNTNQNSDWTLGGGITVNTWSHVAVRIDRVRHQGALFINGVQVGATQNMDGNYQNLDNAAALSIGNLVTTPGQYFAGQIDDVRLYRAALRNTEIAALYAGDLDLINSVRLTTSALTNNQLYSLTASNVQFISGAALPAGGLASSFRYAPTGTLSADRYSVAGGNVSDLTRSAIFPGQPTTGILLTSGASPTNQADNFGYRFRGYFVPPSAGPWFFSIASDDPGQFWMSTNDDPSNVRLVARSNAYSGGTTTFNGAAITQSGTLRGGLTLVAGARYYLEAFHKEGGGGDHLVIAASTTNPVPDGAGSVIAGSQLAPYGSGLRILTQPVDTVAAAGSTVSFSVSIDGAAPVAYQWRLNGGDINTGTNPSAATPVLTLTGVTTANNGNYSVVITSGSNTVTSANALLTVNDLAALPTFGSITLANGPTTGGQSVTVTGTNFVSGSTTVTIGGVAATSVSVTNSTTLTCTTPARAAGAVDVVVFTPAGYATGSGAYTYHAAPTFASISPVAGVAAGGTAVTLTGTNLVYVAGQTSVTFDGIAATNVSSPNATTILCDTPAHAQGQVNVVITTPGGSVTATNAYTYYSAPTLSGSPISPTAGPIAGGTAVTLSGANFAPGLTTVTFGGTAATNILVPGGIGSGTITCTAPAHAAGSVDVVVTTPGGTVTGTGIYTYYDAPTAGTVSPAAGPIAGGPTITITGTNFAPGLTTVTFGGTAATGVNVSGPASLTCTLPAHAAGLVDVVLTTPGGSVTFTGAFTYYGTPTISLVTPADGPIAGGQALDITGTNFAPGLTTVTFGGAAATGVAVASATALSLNTPAHVSGAVDVVLTTPGGSVTLVNGYIYHDPPTATTLTPTTGPTSGGTGVTIGGGSNLPAGKTTVTFGGTAATNVVAAGTSLTCTTPSHTAGTFNVVVTTPGGSVTVPIQFTYSGPFIASITPSNGPIAGGQTVTLTGTDLNPGGAVTLLIGGAAATITSNTGTQIIATTPAHAAGAADVVVQTTGGNDDLPGGYTFWAPATISAVTLNQGPAAGGQTVTITGTNLVQGHTAVTFGGITATGISISGPTSLTCVTPAGTGAVDVVVSTFGTSPSTLAGGYTFVPPPTLDLVTPNRGSIGGGQTVTLTGSNFVAGQTTVTFGASAATGVLVTSTSSLTCVTPANAAGPVAVTVTTFGLQSGSLPSAYTYVNPATTTDLELAQVVSNLTPGLGETLTFTYTLSNAGTLAATNVLVSAPLPSGLTLVGAVPSVGTYAAGTWTVGNLGVAGSATLTITATLDTTALVMMTVEVSSVTESDVDSTPLNGIPGEDDYATVSLQATLSISTPALLPDATSGAFYWQPLTVIGGAPDYSWSLVSGTLPFNLDPATGLISGAAPATPGTYIFTLQVTDSDSPAVTATRQFTINVLAANGAAAVVNAAPVPPAATVGTAYDFTFTAVNGNGSYTWTPSAGTLPTGLLLDPVTGRLSGTPTTTGTFNFTIQATGSGGPGSQAFSILVSSAPLAFVTTGLPGGSVGAFYTHGVEVQGGLGPTFSWTVSSGTLPTGLSLSGIGRRVTLSGTPPGNGSSTFTLQASDDGQPGVTASRPFTLVIASGTSAFEFTTVDLPAGTQGAAYAASLSARGGTRPYSFSLASGVLPSGITLNGLTGTFAGTPSVAGRYELLVRATDFVGATSSGALTLDIAPAPSIPTASPLAVGVQGRPYGALLTMSGGQAPATWSVTGGALPGGVALNPFSGMLSGTPSATGSFSFDATVTDASGASATKTFAWDVVPAGTLAVLVTSLPSGQVGLPYSATLTASGGTPPYTWTLATGALPSWATLDAALGTISGIPNAAGSSTFTLTVSGGGTANSGTLTLLVLDAMTVGPAALAGAAIGVPYTQALTATGASGAVTWAVVEGSLPAGLSLDSTTGVVSGTPASASGTFKVQATDSLGRSAQRRYTLGAGGGPPPPGVAGPTDGSGGNSCSLAAADAGTIRWTWPILAVIMLALRRRRRGA